MLDDMFEQAIIMGMPYELFWDGEPSLYYRYLNAYNRKIDNDIDEWMYKENYSSWLQGCYVYEAIARLPPLGKPKEYLSKPYEINNKKSTDENKGDSSSDMTQKEEEEAVASFYAFGQYAQSVTKDKGNV